jgi:hypothetical protein
MVRHSLKKSHCVGNNAAHRLGESWHHMRAALFCQGRGVLARPESDR